MPTALFSLLQVLGIVLISLVTGAMFGIWRGYDPAAYSPTTFVEVHQASVRGLNLLLPMMALGSLVVVLVLAWLGRDRPQVLGLYLAAAVAIAIGGAVTRFGNQPINATIMGWTSVPPDGWQALRNTWWSLHLTRLGAGLAAQFLLIAAVFADRG